MILFTYLPDKIANLLQKDRVHSTRIVLIVSYDSYQVFTCKIYNYFSLLFVQVHLPKRSLYVQPE